MCSAKVMSLLVTIGTAGELSRTMCLSIRPAKELKILVQQAYAPFPGKAVFSNTDLDYQLHQRHITRVVIAGLVASTCVRRCAAGDNASVQPRRPVSSCGRRAMLPIGDKVLHCLTCGEAE